MPKETNALRFGILGAARIAPNALINPSKSHPEVIVAAVASRSQVKVEAYARKHNIHVVYSGEGCYQSESYRRCFSGVWTDKLRSTELIEDPSIDAIYNPVCFSVFAD